MTLHERIKEKMRQLNLSKAELARKTDIPYSTVDNWFKRNSYPSSEIIENLAKALNTSSEWIITGKEPEAVQTEDVQELLNYYYAANQEGKIDIRKYAKYAAKEHPSNLNTSGEESG